MTAVPSSTLEHAGASGTVQERLYPWPAIPASSKFQDLPLLPSLTSSFMLYQRHVEVSHTPPFPSPPSKLLETTVTPFVLLPLAYCPHQCRPYIIRYTTNMPGTFGMFQQAISHVFDQWSLQSKAGWRPATLHAYVIILMMDIPIRVRYTTRSIGYSRVEPPAANFFAFNAIPSRATRSSSRQSCRRTWG